MHRWQLPLLTFAAFLVGAVVVHATGRWLIGAFDSSPSDWLCVLVAALAGLAARSTTTLAAPGRPTLGLIPVFFSVALFAREMMDLPKVGVSDAQIPHFFGWALHEASPLALLGLVAMGRRPMLVAGAATAVLLAYWSIAPMPYLPVLAFLGARDLSALDRTTPPWHQLALYGVGALGMFIVLLLTFDLAATVAHESIVQPWGVDGPSWGFRADAAPLRWLRIASEVGLLASCAAHIRGRTWGVLGIMLFMVTLFFGLAAASRLPEWSAGCFSRPYPLAKDPLLLPFMFTAYLAVAPWLGPILRVLLYDLPEPHDVALGSLHRPSANITHAKGPRKTT